MDNDVFDQGKPQSLAIGAAIDKHPGETARYRDDAELHQMMLLSEMQPYIQFFVAKKRERMLLVDDLRRQKQAGSLHENSGR